VNHPQMFRRPGRGCLTFRLGSAVSVAIRAERSDGSDREAPGAYVDDEDGPQRCRTERTCVTGGGWWANLPRPTTQTDATRRRPGTGRPSPVTVPVSIEFCPTGPATYNRTSRIASIA
jgi:hypothetical protein